MTKTDLARELLFHIRLGEDSSIEFKQVVCEGPRIIGPHKDKMALEIAAFANSQGGRIVLGVDDKTREVLGIADEQVARVEEWVVTLSQQAINPPVPLHTRLLQLPDRAGMAKTVIYVEIPRSIMVHASNGRYYQRVGSTKQEMKPEVLMRLFQQRSQSRLIRFDETLVPATTLDDLDRSLLQRFLRADTPEADQLRKLHLSASEHGQLGLSISGVLLLTPNPTQWLGNAYVQCVCYSGTERDAHDQLDATKTIGRQDLPQYDLGAVFEAIVNAVAHRDYSMTGRRIRLHMFVDRLELYSPGALPNSLSLDGLMENTVTRNETIVNLLSRYYNAREEVGRQALIERRGEGVPKIIKASEALSGKRPEYRLVDDDELLLIIYAASKDVQDE